MPLPCLAGGFDESESLKLCIDWHNTLDGPRARTTFHTPTKQLTDLLRETQGSWRSTTPSSWYCRTVAALMRPRLPQNCQVLRVHADGGG